jgi:hypothetical protein
MKPRSFFLILATGAISIFLVGVGGLYWLVAQSPLNLLAGGVNIYPHGAIFVPKQAPAMVSLLVNPEKLSALHQLSVPINSRNRDRLEWNQLKTNLLANTGLNYQQDIKPWLGTEVTLAITSLDYDRNDDNGVQPGYLLATATKNTGLAKELLETAWSKKAIVSKTDLVLEQYKGVKIISHRVLNTKLSRKSHPSIWASAVVGDFVLFANQPQVLREAINNAQAVNLNLDHADYYQVALNTIEQPQIGFAYINYPSALAWLEERAVVETPNFEQMLTAAFSIRQSGLAAETALIGIERAGDSVQPRLGDRTLILGKPLTALSYLPAENILALAGKDLAGFSSQFTTDLNSDTPVAKFVNQILTRVQTALEIDLAADIFPWVKGKYALSLVSQPQTSDFGWLFVAESTPEADDDLNEAISHLDNLAQQRGLDVSKFQVGDNQITTWTKLITASGASGRNSVTLNTDVKGAYSHTDKYVFLASSLEAIATALNQQNSWLENPKSPKIVKALPVDSDGYVYINFADGKSMLEKQIPRIRVMELVEQSLLDHARAIAFSSKGTQDGTTRATILFNFDG